MFINATADLVSPCATPRPDQGPQSFDFPPTPSSSQVPEAESEPSTPRPPSMPQFHTTGAPPVQQESERFRMRKARILRYELEQVLEDNAAIKSIQDLHNSHILSVHAIKTEFYDLDGLSWSEPSARYFLDLSSSPRNEPISNEDSLPTTPLSSSFSGASPSTASPVRTSSASSGTTRPVRALPSRRRPLPLPPSASPPTYYSTPSSPTIRRPRPRAPEPTSPCNYVRMAPPNPSRPRLVAVYNLAHYRGRGRGRDTVPSNTINTPQTHRLVMSGNGSGKGTEVVSSGVVGTMNVRNGEWRRPDMIVTMRR